MRKSLFIFNSRRIPWAFISSVILFLVIQLIMVSNEGFWKANYFLSSLPEGDPIRFESLLKISEKDNRKKVFILGTSQTREGIDTGYLNNEFKNDGIIFYNLSVAGAAQPIDLYMLKDKILDNNPYAIVYMPYIESFYLEYNKDQFVQIVDFFHPRILPYFIKYLGIKETVVSYTKPILGSLLGDVSILFRHRNNIRDNIFTAMNILFGLEERDAPLEYQNFGMKSDSYYEKKLEEYGEDKYKPSKYSDLNNLLFTKWIKDFDEKGVPVVIIDGPTHPLFKKVFREEVASAYTEYLQAQADKYNSLFLPVTKMPQFSEEYFTDMVHFNQEGRKIFTEFISEYLKEELSSPSKLYFAGM